MDIFINVFKSGYNRLSNRWPFNLRIKSPNTPFTIPQIELFNLWSLSRMSLLVIQLEGLLVLESFRSLEKGC